MLCWTAPAVFEQRECEGGGAAAASTDAGRGAARGVVVVAEVFVAFGFAEAWAAAAASVGEDVSALEAFGLFGHGGSFELVVLCSFVARFGMAVLTSAAKAARFGWRLWHG